MRTLLATTFAMLASTAVATANAVVVVNPDGTVARGAYTVAHISTGRYIVETPGSVRSCAYSVTAGSGDTTIPSPAIATAVGATEDLSAIRVSTYDSKGNYADSGFHLIVRCTDAGPQGAAVVDPDGTLNRGINATAASRADVGAYTVTFDDPSIGSTCAYTAAIGLSATSGSSDPGFVTVAEVDGGTIAVRTYDPKGNAADLGFHVYAACNT